MLENITIIIKTFERFESLDYLLSSIVKMNLPCPVLIADDSKTSYKDDVIKKYGDIIENYIDLPFDSGASKGRNVLVDHVRTEYFLLAEDDFIFDKRINLEWMLECLMDSDLDLIGGMYYNRPLLIQDENHELLKNLIRFKVRTLSRILLWRIYQYERLRNLSIFKKEVVWDFFGNFKILDGICYLTRLRDHEYVSPYTRCDYVPDFFLAITQKLKEKNVYWDDEIRYYGEHLDFFFRAKRQSLNVAITKDAGVIHQRIHNRYYRRGRDDRNIMMAKNNLREIRLVDKIPN